VGGGPPQKSGMWMKSLVELVAGKAVARHSLAVVVERWTNPWS